MTSSPRRDLAVTAACKRFLYYPSTIISRVVVVQSPLNPLGFGYEQHDLRSLTLASPVSHAQTARRGLLGAARAHLAGFRLEPRKMRSLGGPERAGPAGVGRFQVPEMRASLFRAADGPSCGLAPGNLANRNPLAQWGPTASEPSPSLE